MPQDSDPIPGRRLRLRFARDPRSGSYLVPATGGGLREVTVPVELRRDPLTGRSGRLAHFQGFQLRRAELGAAVEASRPNCPFCPPRIWEATPLLPSRVAIHGRLVRGEAVLFPNISPYDRLSVVAALTSEHFVAPQDFTTRQLVDGVGVVQKYFQTIAPAADGNFSLLTWNYMPPAGATQIHPHLQAFSTDRPGTLLEEEVRRSRTFLQRRGFNFWEGLVAEERRLGDRFLGEGPHTAWLTAFVSRSVISDVMVIFRDQHHLEDLPAAAVEELAAGLRAALRFFADEGVSAFNLAFYPAPAGAGKSALWLHARLSPRIYFNPDVLGSDNTAWQHLLDEPFMVRSPESLAATLGPALRAALRQG